MSEKAKNNNEKVEIEMNDSDNKKNIEQDTNSLEELNEKDDLLETVSDNSDNESDEENNETEILEEDNNEDNEIEKLKNKIKELEKEKADIKDKYLRDLAELQNFKKRQNEQMKSIRKFALESVMVELLPILDNFRLAFKDVDNITNVENAKQIIEGLKMIESQLENTLNKYGLKKFSSEDEVFDPNVHQAVQTEKVEDEDLDNKVLEEYQAGYKLNEKVIRHSMVKVGKYE
jgi:molecular chaperone GrpE